MGTQEDVVRDTEMRSQCLYTYTLYMKYNLIIDITVNLDESFSAIKDCTLKKISLFYFDPAKIMGIPQFTKDLFDILEKKSISSDFRKKLIHPKGATGAIPKKKGIIDRATELNMKDSPEVKTQFNEEFTKRCTPWAKEKEIQADLKTVLTYKRRQQCAAGAKQF